MKLTIKIINSAKEIEFAYQLRKIFKINKLIDMINHKANLAETVLAEQKLRQWGIQTNHLFLFYEEDEEA